MPRLTNKPRKRKDGRYEVRLSILEDGKRVRLSAYGSTAKEAESKARDLKTRAERGLLPKRDKLTLAGFAESWLRRKAKEVRPRTVALYQQELTYALPSLEDPQAHDPLGSKRLQEVQPVHLRAALDSLGEHYSARTVKMVRQRLHQLFEEALNLELVYRNPVAPIKVKAKGGTAKERAGRSLEPHEVAVLLRALDAHPDPRTAMAIRLMLACGLRRGEVLGLQWEDINLEAGTLTVRRVWSEGDGEQYTSEPKTATSRRPVPIPHSTLGRLEQYRAGWAKKLGELPPDMWVFPGNDPSKPLHTHAPNWALRRIITRIHKEQAEREEKSGVKEIPFPNIRVHDLRHSYGSLLLANGAPLELVAERMGHANPTITLNVYRHVLQHERQGWLLDPEDLAHPRAKA